jgi:hypothetical protein
MTIDAMKLALEALYMSDMVFYPQTKIAIAAVEEAIEQAQKPKEFSKVFALMKSTDDPCTEVMAVGQLMKEWLEVVVADAGTVIDTGKGFSEFDLWVQCEGKELFITIEEKRPTK